MYLLKVKKRFSAAHLLRNYQGKCAELHGHTWFVEVAVSGRKLNQQGMLVDFGELKSRLAEQIDQYDHSYLNEHTDFSEQNPTAENLARVLFDRLARALGDSVAVDSVTVWESPDACAVYRRD